MDYNKVKSLIAAIEDGCTIELTKEFQDLKKGEKLKVNSFAVFYSSGFVAMTFQTHGRCYDIPFDNFKVIRKVKS